MKTKKKKKWVKRTIIIGIVLALIVVIVFLSMNGPKDMGYDNETAKISDVTTYYSFSGDIQAKEKRQMLAEGNYKITRFLVKEGDIVKEGDLLYEIDNENMQAQLDQAAAAVQVAQTAYDAASGSGTKQQLQAAENAVASAKLNYDNAGKGAVQQQLTSAESAVQSAQSGIKSAQSAVSSAKLNVKNAQDAVNKLTILYNEGAISKNELDQAQTQLDQTKTQLEQAQTQLSSTNNQYQSALKNRDLAKDAINTSVKSAKMQLDQAQKNLDLIRGSVIGSNLNTAKAQLDQAIAAYNTVEKQMTSHQVMAKIPGEITKIYADANTTIMAGTPVLDLVDYTSLNAVVKVDEYDIGAIVAGKKVIVTVSALSRDVEGTVRRLTKETDKVKNISYFVAEIALPEDRQLLEGMSVEVKALNASVKNAVTISMKALQFDNENKPYVYFMDKDDKIVPHDVTIGINDGLTVEIKGGLSDGEKVYYPKQIVNMNMGHEMESTGGDEN